MSEGKFERKDLLLAYLLWDNHQPISVSHNVKSFIEAFSKNFTSMTKLDERKMKILAMICQILCVHDKIKCHNVLKDDLVFYFAQSIRRYYSHITEDVFLKISLLKPGWLSLNLNLALVNKPHSDIGPMVSLRNIINQVSFDNEIIENDEARNGKDYESPETTSEKLKGKGKTTRNFNLCKKNHFGNFQ